MIELRTLGRLELLQLRDGVVRAIPLQTKRLTLLAYLAAHSPDGFCRRDTLLALFWPELDQEHARGALRQALHFLRKAIGEGALRNRGEDEVGLDRAALRSDAQLLEAALVAGEPEAALAWYRGDFLEGVFVTDGSSDLEDWIAAERTRLRGVAAKAAWMAAERPTGQGNTGGYIREAIRLSGDDERALRRGLRMLDRMGDQAGVTALYEDFASRVARDLEVGLSAETQEMIAQVRARRPAAGPPPRGSATPGDSPAPSATGAMAGVPLEDPARPITPPRRRLRFAGLVGAGGALVTLALAAYLGSGGAAKPVVSPDRIAVVPFRITGADSSLAWLHEGIVDLLTIRIAGDGGPDLASPSWVLSEWSRLAGGGRTEAPPEVAQQVATRVGAGRRIEGAVTGSAGRVTLTAQLSAASDDGAGARAVVEGSADSLPQLIDRLAAQLLGLSAGMEGARLASLTSSSLPAIRAYLRGEAAFRAGRMTAAVEGFREATTLDSTFALAGFRMSRAAIWTGFREEQERGVHIAQAGRARLSRTDRLLLDATSLPDVGASVMFAAWDAAISAAPDNPEAWYLLGDAHYHWGRLAGEEDAMQRAALAFRRGWLLDSLAGGSAAAGLPIAEPAAHLAALAHMAGDTAAVLRLASAVLRADSTSDLAHVLAWHRAAVTGDAARLAYRERLPAVSQDVLKDIHLFILWTGLETEDLAWLIPAERERFTVHDPGWASLTVGLSALNAGRPGQVPDSRIVPGLSGHRLLGHRIRRAIWWDADSSDAEAAVATLRSFAESGPVSGAGQRQQLYDLCVLGEWYGGRGDHRRVAAASQRLRAARPASLAPADSAKLERHVALCASLLDAMGASELGMPDVRARIAIADSIARENIFEVCCGDGVLDVNLQLARLWEREGDLTHALAALRRRAAGFPIQPYFLSTFLREEGRLALLTGDSTGAARAWRHYLALRPDPEPHLRPGVDSVRQALAGLEAP